MEYRQRQIGLLDIGYHILIGARGSIHWGWRGLDAIGCHTPGPVNAKSIGVCLLGGLDKFDKPADTFDDQQRRVLYIIAGMFLRQFEGLSVKAIVSRQEVQKARGPKMVLDMEEVRRKVRWLMNSKEGKTLVPLYQYFTRSQATQKAAQDAKVQDHQVNDGEAQPAS